MFTLTGFNTMKRDGIELPANFTATVNADLRVGALEETIIVSGRSPVVDVQNTAPRSVIPTTVLDTIPSAGKALTAYVALIPGIVAPAAGQDVGGSKVNSESVSRFMAVTRRRCAGSRTGWKSPRRMAPDPAMGSIRFPPARKESASISAGDRRGERWLDSAELHPENRRQPVQRLGQRQLCERKFQWDNLTDTLRRRGLTNVNPIQKVWDFSGAFGGPIRRDRLWSSPPTVRGGIRGSWQACSRTPIRVRSFTFRILMNRASEISTTGRIVRD